MAGAMVGRMPEQRVTVRLHSTDDATRKAWISMQVGSCDDPRQVEIDIDPVQGVRNDATCFLHLPNDSEGKVLKSDIVGGLLMARKQLGRVGFRARLLSLGGSVGDEPRITQVASVAFAVGALSAVLWVLGDEQLRPELTGGFGWKIDAIEPLTE
jgi:hypothetical protein